MTPIREQVYDAMCMALPGATSQDVKAATGAAVAFLDGVDAEIVHLRLIANAAGQGWKAAQDEVEKAHERIALLEGEIEAHLRDQLAVAVKVERQRQELADAKRWIYSYKGLPLTELRASLEAAVRHSDDYGLSSVCVDLPTGEDLFALISQLTERAT